MSHDVTSSAPESLRPLRLATPASHSISSLLSGPAGKAPLATPAAASAGGASAPAAGGRSAPKTSALVPSAAHSVSSARRGLCAARASSAAACTTTANMSPFEPPAAVRSSGQRAPAGLQGT